MFGEKVEMLRAMRDLRRSSSNAAPEPLPPLSDDPLISVVILTRDRQALLEQTLTALGKQSYALREVIVADNANGGSVPIAQAHAARVVHAPGLSLGAARQAAVDGAVGEIVAFTDDDCLPDRQWLCRIVHSLRDHPDWHGVQGRTEAARGPLGSHAVAVSAPNSLFQTCNMAYRSAAIRRSGGFDTRFEAWFEDTALGARVLSHGPIGWEPEAVVVHQAVPAEPITAERWKRIVADERLLASEYASFYRRTRGPLALVSIVSRTLVGSPVKALIRAAPRAPGDPTGYVRLVSRLGRERMALLAALWQTRR
jgi:GT2 family glycosyltransferase